MFLLENLRLTCQRLKQLGYSTDTYLLDVDGYLDTGVIQAHCDMSTDPATTIVNATSGSMTTECNNCGQTNVVGTTIVYTQNDSTISTLVKTSTSCVQDVDFTCNSSTIASTTPFLHVYTKWNSHQNQEIRTWGKGPFAGGCECVINNTCSNGTYRLLTCHIIVCIVIAVIEEKNAYTYTYNWTKSYTCNGWLSLENRRFLHKFAMVFKCRNGLASLYIIDSFNANTFIHSYSTRHSTKLRIPIARTEYYHRSFLISGCNAWNNLPNYIRKSVSLNSFKFNMFKYLLAKTQF